VSEVILGFMRHAMSHYRSPDGEPTQELQNVKDALRHVRRLFGDTPASSFGGLALRRVRDHTWRSPVAAHALSRTPCLTPFPERS
jgi:hypothetical protein